VEKKISNWCYRWLSIGGRFTLLKVVLESQPIYWLSLAVVPIYVLNSLRKLMYNFLWHRTNESYQIHLCRWEQIALPKSFGGWGIRNIFDFSNSLAANTLWRVLNGKGIWHRVICDKYIHDISVITGLDLPLFRLVGFPEFGVDWLKLSTLSPMVCSGFWVMAHKLL
jgi:hypothetical protein